ncbi:MAG: cytochrome c oxidase subunit 3 [Halieaceae bacterium]|nr:cytochrome c oxidase subunit 3 [Halieaceae bacterium]
MAHWFSGEYRSSNPDVCMDPNSETSEAKKQAKRIPGEAEFWLFIMGDLLVFTVLFLFYVFQRKNNLAQFQVDQALLSQNIGLLNTLILLTSSLLVAIGVQRLRLQRQNVSRFLIGGIFFGIFFVVVKALEYREKLVSGIDLSGEYSFFMLYFAMTGIHLAHVILGILVLLIALNLSRKEQPIRYLKFVECSAIFWHMVDLLWLVIFALLYVIR